MHIGFNLPISRPLSSPEILTQIAQEGEAVPEKASDGNRRLFSGGTADIVADLRALRDLGVSAVDMDFERPDPAASIAEMRRFKDVVLSRLWSPAAGRERASSDGQGAKIRTRIAARARRASGSGAADEPVQLRPHPVKRLSHDLGIAHGLSDKFRPRSENRLRDFDRLCSEVLLDHLREAFRE